MDEHELIKGPTGRSLAIAQEAAVESFARSARRPVAETECAAIRDWVARTLLNAGLLDQVVAGKLAIGLREGEVTSGAAEDEDDDPE